MKIAAWTVPVRAGFVARAAVFAVAAAAPGAALAQSQADDWKFRAQIYLWAPSISGQTNFPVSTGGYAVNADFSDVLENLEFAFMGTLEARQGRWGVLTDFIYLNFRSDKSATRDLTISGPGGVIQIPANATADANLGLRGWQWALAGTYALIDRPGYELQALGGLRMLKMDTSLSWNFTSNIGGLPPTVRSGSAIDKSTWWDAIIGVRGRANLGDSKWFVPYYLDVGTGETDLTWQAMAGIGYAFRWGEITAAYRHLSYDFASNDALKDLSFSGPLVSVGFSW